MKLCYYMVSPYDIDHVGFLYLLLSKRRDCENISHSNMNMPSFTAHQKFIEKNPYFVWWIVQLADDSGTGAVNIGSVYLTTKNEIGIHLLPEYQNQGYGRQILKWITDEYYTRAPFYANINPTNEKSIKLFKRAGFEQIQVTYKLDWIKLD